jgi:hypothetical protein
MRELEKSVALLLCSTISLAACIAPGEKVEALISQQLAVFEEPEGTLLFEESFTTSSATGECAGLVSDLWYGTNRSFAEIQRAYEGELEENDWEIWPEDVVEIWRKEERPGVYSFSISDHTNDLDADQFYYSISDEALSRAMDFTTIYRARASFLYSWVAKRCYGLDD